MLTTSALVRVAATLVIAIVALAAGPDGTAAEPDQRMGEVIVRLAGGATPRSASSLGQRVVAVERVAGAEVARVAVPAGAEAEVARTLAAQSGVAWAAPNVRMRLLASDPASEPQRGLQWHLDQVNADRAWAFTTGDSAVKVALVDTGIDAGHQDRPARIEIGPSFADPTLFGDAVGHGTLSAGIVAAPVNGMGVVGLAPDVTVQVLKVDDVIGNVYVFDVYRAMLWAVDHGARIVNVSMGTTEDSPMLREAADYARARGVLVVAAAGNAAASGNPVFYPAALPNVLAVGATTVNRQRAPYSESGPYLGLLAPGGDGSDRLFGGVYTTAPGGGYGSLTGTSAAAPLAAAAAALVWSIDRSQSADAVRERLLATASDLDPRGRDEDSGAGLLDAGAAVAAAAATQPYRASFRGQACPSIVAGGGRTALRFDVANTGGRSWTRGGPNAVTLTTNNPAARASPFYTAGAWTSPSVASLLPIDELPPAGRTSFDVILSAPTTAGPYREYFRIVAQGVGTLLELYCDVTVVPPTSWLAADATAVATTRLAPGGTGRAIVTVRNVGTTTWRRDGSTPVRLGTDAPRDRDSALRAPSWLSSNRATAMLEAEVPPGGVATFAFDVVAPNRAGLYRDAFTPVIDGVTWLNASVEIAIDVRS
jgi:subtilisin family serine protease